MKADSVLVAAEAAEERRLRRVPWGVEVQIWRLVETQTYPDTAANLSLNEFLGPEATAAAATAPGFEEDQMHLPWSVAP